MCRNQEVELVFVIVLHAHLIIVVLMKIIALRKNPRVQQSTEELLQNLPNQEEGQDQSPANPREQVSSQGGQDLGQDGQSSNQGQQASSRNLEDLNQSQQGLSRIQPSGSAQRPQLSIDRCPPVIPRQQQARNQLDQPGLSPAEPRGPCLRPRHAPMNIYPVTCRHHRRPRTECEARIRMEFLMRLIDMPGLDRHREIEVYREIFELTSRFPGQVPLQHDTVRRHGPMLGPHPLLNRRSPGLGMDDSYCT